MSRNSINRNLQKILTPRSTKKLVNWATQINILKSFYIDLFIHYLLSKGSKTIYPKTCRTNETKAGKQEQRNMSSVVRQLELGISWAEKQGNVCSECVGRGARARVCVCVCVCAWWGGHGNGSQKHSVASETCTRFSTVVLSRQTTKGSTRPDDHRPG